MLVSVIIPNYNNSKYLEFCLDSVITQGWDIVKEVIVVDDESSDDSWDVLKRYESLFESKISVFKNPKKGVQNARNYGFSKSSGKYIQWLDSDDALSDNKLKSQIEVLEMSEDNDVAFCGWAHFTNTIESAIVRPNKVWKSYELPIQWLTDSWNGGGMMQTACWLISRDMAMATSWDVNVLKNQDGIYFFNVLLNCNKLHFIENILVYYRIPSAQNISKKKDTKTLASLLSTYKYYERILSFSNDKYVRIALGCNYANFIKYSYPENIQLINLANEYITRLKLAKYPVIGGRKFQLLQKIFGFNLALKIDKIIKNEK